MDKPKPEFSKEQDERLFEFDDDFFAESPNQSNELNSADTDTADDFDKQILTFTLSHIYSLRNEDDETINTLVDILMKNDPKIHHHLYNSGYPYDKHNKGCNLNDPFLIEQIDNYVHLEYCLVYVFLEFQSYSYKVEFEQQELIAQGDRKIDHLIFKVQHTPDDEDFQIENYYFDITAGYDALSRYF